MKGTAPELSVVLTVVEGPTQTRRCLESLRSQTDPPEMEILVPWDASIAEVATWDEPGLRCIEISDAPPLDRPDDEDTRHVLYDLRRSAGLRAAAAPRVAILEDRGVPTPTWARAMVNTLDQTGAAAVGGAIRCGVSTRWARAVYLLDFGDYAPSFDEHPTVSLSDTNVVYRQDALERVRGAWENRYHEPDVHGALTQQGEILLLSPVPIVVQQRTDLSLDRVLRERVAWGRLYGSLLARDRSTAWRLLRAAASAVVLPVLLPFRVLRREGKRGRMESAFGLLPWLFLAAAAWAMGESMGLGSPASTSHPSPTDETLGEENPA